MSSSLDPALYGMALGATSILSVGPNNLMLIREGLARGRVGFVATAVCLSYVSLLLAALLLAGTIPQQTMLMRSLLSGLSLAAISAFAILSFRAAFRTDVLRCQPTADEETRSACLRRVFAVVWLNPLTYVEIFLIPSAICDSFGETGARLEFVIGLVAIEAITCYGYAFGAGLCAPLFRHRRSLQVFDLASGLVMTGMALSVAFGMASLGR